MASQSCNSESRAFGKPAKIRGLCLEKNRTRPTRVQRLLGLILEERDEIIAVLGLLEAAKGHLSTRNVLLGVLEVVELGCALDEHHG